MYGPKCLLSSKLLCQAGALLKKQYAVSSRKGVVGSTGNAMPIMPKISEMVPTIRKINFIIDFSVLN